MMKTKWLLVWILTGVSSSLWGYETLAGPQMDVVQASPMLEYDVIYPNEWGPDVQEAFVIPSPPGFPDLGERVCLKPTHTPDRYLLFTMDEAEQYGLLAVSNDDVNRTWVPRDMLTHDGRFLEGDPQLFADGDRVYLTGTVADPRGWAPVVDIYESPMYPDGKDFDFKYRATYNPSVMDFRFDYYSVGGVIVGREGKHYVLVFTGCRVPKGQPEDWKSSENEEQIQTLYYALATRDENGDFAWQGHPRAINAFVKDVTLGVDLGTMVAVQKNRPLTWPIWEAPPGGQINGMHLNGNVYEIDGERWMYWAWFEHGNHNASAKIADDFRFFDPRLTKEIWDTSTDVVRNTSPVLGEQGINENAITFKRNGVYYFIFTHGYVTGSYGMSYIMGSNFETLARGVGREYKLYECFPNLGDANLWTPGRQEIAGSGGAAIKPNGDIFLFYGVGTYNRMGHYLGRQIHYSKLLFNADDTIVPLKVRPKTTTEPHVVPDSIQLTWTPNPDYEYHLNVLADGLHAVFPHPTDPEHYGSGYAQLDAGCLSNQSSWDLTEVMFESVTYPKRRQMIPIADISGLDGFQLSYAYGGDWRTDQQHVRVGYRHGTRQHIPIGEDAPESFEAFLEKQHTQAAPRY